MQRHPSLDMKPEMGFHGLKSQLKTRDYLQEYCEFLAPCVHEAAWATRGAAYLCRRSVKDRRYLGLTRKEGAALTHPEVRYERAMFQKWSSGSDVPDCGWRRLVDYQVPVSDRKPSVLGLKAIDLLGIDAYRLPIVIELKIVRGRNGADSPLLAILEAASYACVLQTDWTQFRIELDQVTRPFGIDHPLPEKLDRVSLVIAGSPEYWAFWNYEARSSFVKAKPALRTLVEAFQREGFPISFVCVEGTHTDPATFSAREARFLD